MTRAGVKPLHRESTPSRRMIWEAVCQRVMGRGRRLRAAFAAASAAALALSPAKREASATDTPPEAQATEMPRTPPVPCCPEDGMPLGQAPLLPRLFLAETPGEAPRPPNPCPAARPNPREVVPQAWRCCTDCRQSALCANPNPFNLASTTDTTADTPDI